MVPITSSPAWSLGHRKVCDAAFFFFLSLIHLTKDNHTCLCQMPGTGKEKSALTWIVCSTVEKIVQDTQQTCNDLPLTTHTQNSLPLPAGLGWCRTLHTQRKEQPLSRQLCFWLEPWAPRGGYGPTQSFPVISYHASQNRRCHEKLLSEPLGPAVKEGPKGPST